MARAEEFKEREDAVETYNQLEQDCAKTKERIEEIRLEIEQKESELIEIEKKIQQFKFAEDLTDALDKLHTTAESHHRVMLNVHIS